jgi:hypothetical protein
MRETNENETGTVAAADTDFVCEAVIGTTGSLSFVSLILPMLCCFKYFL